MAVQLIPELASVPGVEVVGPFPKILLGTAFLRTVIDHYKLYYPKA